MIDRFAENDLKHIRRLPDKSYHHNNREERSNVTLQKQLYATVLNLPYGSHINNKTKQPSMQKGANWRLIKHTEIIHGTFNESSMH